MSCQPAAASFDICPTTEEIVPQLIALLPRGRAWGTHDGGPFPGSVAWRFWSAVASVLAYFNARACQLLVEFFCVSAAETHDTWMQEYGLPDGCDPYPDLCTKVAAVGGTRCDYYRAIAARAGWAITCTDLYDACGSKAGNAFPGSLIAGRGLPPRVLLITVMLPDSPAHVGGAPSTTVVTSSAGLAPPYAGRLEAGGLLSCPAAGETEETFFSTRMLTAGCAQAGQLLACPPAGEITLPLSGALLAGARLGCLPDLSGLECLLARIVGADVLLIYETAS